MTNLSDDAIFNFGGIAFPSSRRFTEEEVEKIKQNFDVPDMFPQNYRGEILYFKNIPKYFGNLVLSKNDMEIIADGTYLWTKTVYCTPYHLDPDEKKKSGKVEHQHVLVTLLIETEERSEDISKAFSQAIKEGVKSIPKEEKEAYNEFRRSIQERWRRNLKGIFSE